MKLRFVFTLLFLLLTALMLPVMAFAAPQNSADGVPLFFNGKQLKPEVAPRIIKDVTMVPIRIIAEELGSKVEWNQAAHKVIIMKDSMKIEMVIDQLSATVNGVTNKLDSAPLLIEGNTLLPVRFIAENMGVEVNWNDVQRAVYLQEKRVSPGDKPSPVNPDTAPTNKPLPVIKTIEMTTSQLLIKADSGELKPTQFTLQNPRRIVVDIPNAVLDPSLYKDQANKSGESVSSNVYVANVRYSLYNVNPGAVRIVLDMKEPMDLKWEAGLNTAALAGVLQKGAKYKVVIDPGHGDQDPGAKAVNGSTEKEFNLSMGLKVYKLLQKEALIEPFLTRNDDTFVPLDDRAEFANSRNADLFVSIHGNSYTSASTGTETYYYKSDSDLFAQIMHKHLTAATGLPDRGVRQQPFRVVKATNMPAVLLEVGYLSNERDTALMFDEAFQDRVALAIVAGIKEQLKIQ
ncbi:N-acetylmuramoyl-L-alanine amidase family protein [Paenibacillus radicis (ex Xue et al. 2023)]|uniref:N-acetylmuramoyl-L-alanine amidase family protein n=1 Tax=Paenibacillus radicis (ex Xue et al. 2023) TaxID=2972489 RepID=A0ABT1YRK3_9BACL|nr:N-acetylmuramoyl-L-alanine amidase family protein [Paenibacillus radicis (ex Xue et al. 2023)]MCR8635009.1 N-acetylmuramoyl-L-alanine amidase family protein [Paenibacillus radicis (ex Xue et al. 2023)]